MRLTRILWASGLAAMAAMGSGSIVSSAAPTPAPISVSGYTLTPPVLTARGGTALGNWKLRLKNPYTGAVDYAPVRLSHYGCRGFPEPNHPKIVLQGTIAMVDGVKYRVQYEVSGAHPAWTTLAQLEPTALQASGGVFSVNWFDYRSACPTRNISFRLFGSDGVGGEYVSPVKTVHVFPALSVREGPRQPPNYHVGTVWFRKFRVKDPGVKQIQVRLASKLDLGHRWRLTGLTKFNFVKNIPVRGGWAVFKFRLPSHRTFVFRFTFPATQRHSRFWDYEVVYIGI